MLLTVCALLAVSTPASLLSDYDVGWSTPSKDASASMPLGNGEVVLNAWVEDTTGDLLFYIARTDALSEISRFLKLGRVRVHLEPSPFKGSGLFRQQLRLRDGVVEIHNRAGRINLFVDALSDTVHVTGMFQGSGQVHAFVESWRTQPRDLPKAEQRSAWSVHDAPFTLTEGADFFVPNQKDAVTWYHRNETSVVPKLWENQTLTGLRGTFDPILNRTFGGRLEGGPDFHRVGEQSLRSDDEITNFHLTVTTHTAIAPSVADWEQGIARKAKENRRAKALERTIAWWNAFWNRSWVFVQGDRVAQPVPENQHPIRAGKDSNGQNLFPGALSTLMVADEPMSFDQTKNWRMDVLQPKGLASWISLVTTDPANRTSPDFSKLRFKRGLTIVAWIQPEELISGRIVDKMTAGGNDGFLFDTHPGDGLRLIVGDMMLTAPKCLKKNEKQRVAAIYDAETGEASIYLNDERVAHRDPAPASPITQGYVLQRYMQAIQGRGQYPIKFNGGYSTVEPKASGMDFNADWRNWGDCHWFQNLRHMYHPMLASGDVEMTEPFFKLYESVRPLSEARSKFYHGSQGAYFPETMSVFGTYSGGDYGWDRTGHQPKDVLCPWWDDAWNQGPELVALMLDRWDYTRDEKFLRQRVLPMAESVLRYFDTRFKKDAAGRIVLDPTQVVETYWEGVVNDMPTVAGLIAITDRLTSLPDKLVAKKQQDFFRRMKQACPELPLETEDGASELAPAQKYAPKISNVENGELYGVWPFRLVSLAKPKLMEEARRAYLHRKNKLDKGWGYDGNVAALLGMTDEAARILQIKCANSNSAYRWPATWGPNFDWLPDQNHGGNLLNTTNLMLLQGEPLEAGGAIRILPAWPKAWDVKFKLHAPGQTTVECEAAGGRILKLTVIPASRTRDIVWPAGWERP